MHLAFSGAIYLFILLELARQELRHSSTVMLHLHTLVTRFTDEKDSSNLVAIHIYLLLGCALAFLWTPSYPVLITYSGLFILGIGDSCAAVFINKYRSIRLPALLNSTKSLSGLVGCLVSVLVSCSLVAHFLLFLPIFLSTLATSLLEAYTLQTDNLVLPLFRSLLIPID